jgi:ATP-dependent protease ClpP protease subunit
MADTFNDSTTSTDYEGDPWQTVEPFKSLYIAKLQAEINRLTVETAKVDNERAMSESALVTIQAESRRASIAAQQAQSMNDRELAKDRYNHVMRFNGVITDESIDAAIDELTVWHRLAPKCDMEIVFNSPGGDVTAGIDLFDYIGELKRSGHNTVVAGRGWCASMASILLQAGIPTEEAPRSKRVLGRETQLLLHEPSTMARGKSSDIEDHQAFLRKLQIRVLGIFEAGSKYAFDNGTSEIALTARQFMEGDDELAGVLGWNRRDWTLNSDECLKYGIVDQLR